MKTKSKQKQRVHREEKAQSGGTPLSIKLQAC